MPKLKTNKGAAKRFRRTKTGKLKKRNAGRQHGLNHGGVGRIPRLHFLSQVNPVETDVALVLNVAGAEFAREVDLRAILFVIELLMIR